MLLIDKENGLILDYMLMHFRSHQAKGNENSYEKNYHSKSERSHF